MAYSGPARDLAKIANSGAWDAEIVVFDSEVIVSLRASYFLLEMVFLGLERPCNLFLLEGEIWVRWHDYGVSVLLEDVSKVDEQLVVVVDHFSGAELICELCSVSDQTFFCRVIA